MLIYILYSTASDVGMEMNMFVIASLAVLDQGLSGSIQKKLEQAGIKNGNGGHKNGDD